MRSAAAADTDHPARTPAPAGWSPPSEQALSGQAARPEGVVADQRGTVLRPPLASARWQFPAQPVHARMARIWLEAWIADRGLGQEACYCAAVAFSELVTNAVLHGAGPVTVEVAIEAGRIECEVSDGACDLPVVYEAGEDDEHHRGLCLVEALTSDWRVRLKPEGGKAVAFVVEA